MVIADKFFSNFVASAPESWILNHFIFSRDASMDVEALVHIWFLWIDKYILTEMGIIQ